MAQPGSNREGNKLLTVLIVDDEMYFRKGLCSLIDWESLGFTVSGDVGSGAEGLAFIRRHRPDVILTDINMAEMDGLEFIRQARELQSADSKIIIVSAYDKFDYAKRALEYGVTSYILKPINEDELMQALGRIRQELLPDTSEPVGLVDRVDQYIRTHMDQRMTLQSISKALFVNTAYLGRVYKKQRGVSLTQRINQIKMETAKKMLRSTNQHIYEISQALGYTDSNYFSVLFERLTGQTPSQFRTEISGGSQTEQPKNKEI